MRAAALLALLATGCGGGGDDRNVSTDQIERLATPKKEEKADPQAGARLQPLTLADLDAAGMPDPACDFSRAGVVLVAATSDDAIARIGGRLLHLNHSSPIEPTGGFFEDRQVSVSIGRIAEAQPVGEGGGWPARIIVTNRRAAAQTELGGLWRCRQ
jgi:hypothetical protein